MTAEAYFITFKIYEHTKTKDDSESRKKVELNITYHKTMYIYYFGWISRIIICQ